MTPTTTPQILDLADPHVTVLHHKKVLGWTSGPPLAPLDTYGNPVGGWERFNLTTALRTACPTDAHVQVTTVRDQGPARAPRVNQNAILDNAELDWVIPVAFVDLDRVPHEWWPGGEAADAALQGALGILRDAGLRPAFTYATHRGMRLVFVLKEPVAVQQWGWYTRWLAEAIAPLPWASVGLNPTSPEDCTSVVQLFRLADVQRDDSPPDLKLPPLHEDPDAPPLVADVDPARDHIDLGSAVAGRRPIPDIVDPPPPGDPLWKRSRLMAWETAPYIPIADDWASPDNSPIFTADRYPPGTTHRALVVHLVGRAVESLYRAGLAPSEIPDTVWRLLSRKASRCRQGDAHDHTHGSPCLVWWAAETYAGRLRERVVVVRSHDLVATTREFVAALLPWAYRQGNTMCRPVAGGLRAVTTIPEMRLALAEVADVVRIIPPKKEGEPRKRKREAISKDDAALVLAADLSSLREVEGVVYTPQVTPPGEIVPRHGYDAETGLYYAPQDAWPSPPSIQTQGDAFDVVWEVAESVWREIPFRTDADQAAALLAALTTTLRPTLGYPVPLFLLDANRRNVGKTRLGRALMAFHCGRIPAPACVNMAPGRMREELISLAKAHQTSVFIDNQTKRLGNAHLAGVVVNGRLGGRIFKTHDRVGDGEDVPFRALILATMNDATVDRDFESRTVAIRLHRDQGALFSPSSESPDRIMERDHKHFRIALLAVYAAWIRAGRPRTLGRAPLERFEEWDRELGACIAWASEQDPLAATSEFVLEIAERDSPERELLDFVLRGGCGGALSGGARSTGTTTRREVPKLAHTLVACRLLPTAEGVGVDAILAAIEERDHGGVRYDARSLSRYLQRLRGEPPPGYSLETSRRGGDTITTITAPADAEAERARPQGGQGHGVFSGGVR